MTIKPIIENKKANIEVPDWVRTQVDPENLERLQQGKKSKLATFITPEGRKVTGKIQLHPFQDQGTKILFFEQKQGKIEIPKTIDDETLTQKQINQLLKGKYILLKNGSYVKIDQELNRVMIYSGKEIGEIQSIGGVKLSQEEKLALVNGEEITKVLKNEKNNNYVVTTFKSNEKSELIFDVNKTQVIEPKDYHKYNIKELEYKINIKGADKEQIMRDFIEGNDKALIKIKELVKEGFSPSIESLNKVTGQAPNNRTQALLSVFNLDSTKYDKFQQLIATKEVYNSVDKTKYKLIDYNLSSNKITLESDNGTRIETTLKDNFMTKKEFQTHIQSLSLAKTPTKAVGMIK